MLSSTNVKPGVVDSTVIRMPESGCPVFAQNTWPCTCHARATEGSRIAARASGAKRSRFMGAVIYFSEGGCDGAGRVMRHATLTRYANQRLVRHLAKVPAWLLTSLSGHEGQARGARGARPARVPGVRRSFESTGGLRLGKPKRPTLCIPESWAIHFRNRLNGAIAFSNSQCRMHCVTRELGPGFSTRRESSGGEGVGVRDPSIGCSGAPRMCLGLVESSTTKPRESRWPDRHCSRSLLRLHPRRMHAMEPRFLAAVRASFPTAANTLTLGAPVLKGECHPEQ